MRPATGRGDYACCGGAVSPQSRGLQILPRLELQHGWSEIFPCNRCRTSCTTAKISRLRSMHCTAGARGSFKVHRTSRTMIACKICNRLCLIACTNRFASTKNSTGARPHGRSACVQPPARLAPEPAHHSTPMAGLSGFFLRLGLLGTPALAADARHVVAIAAHGLAALTASFARFVASKFVRIAAGMRGLATATRQQAALLRSNAAKPRRLRVVFCPSSTVPPLDASVTPG